MIDQPTRALLAFIRSKEAPRGYDQLFSIAERKLGRQKLTSMTVAEVLALQGRMVKAGSPSSALGGYQFIRKTLTRIVKELRIDGAARFTPALQDRLAVHLMKARGLDRFLRGDLSRSGFANNLAKEWASLPVVTPINGKKVGQSYYAGDGINKALAKPETVLALIDDLTAEKPGPVIPPPPDIEPAPEPEPAPTKPKLTRWQKFTGAVAAALASAAAWFNENPEIVIGGLVVAALVAAFIIWRKRK